MTKLKFNYKGFRLIAQCTQDDLIEYLSPKLLELYGKDNVDLTKDYLFARGSLPVMLVAHMDTVHKSLPTNIYYDEPQGIIWSPQGIGGDDRCGVYGIIAILSYLAKNGGKLPSVMFTTFEETGCVGAGIAARKVSDSMIAHINYAIQLDRRGENDCVFYQCSNVEFKKMVETYGFETAIGSFTDIGELCPEWDIAGVNLSIGYMSEHTDRETVNVSWMMATLEKTLLMLADSEQSKRYPFQSKLFTKESRKASKNNSKIDGAKVLGSYAGLYYVYDKKEKKYKYYDKMTGEEITDKEAEAIFDRGASYLNKFDDEDYVRDYNFRSKR